MCAAIKRRDSKQGDKGLRKVPGRCVIKATALSVATRQEVMSLIPGRIYEATACFPSLPSDRKLASGALKNEDIVPSMSTNARNSLRSAKSQQSLKRYKSTSHEPVIDIPEPAEPVELSEPLKSISEMSQFESSSGPEAEKPIDSVDENSPIIASKPLQEKTSDDMDSDPGDLPRPQVEPNHHRPPSPYGPASSISSIKAPVKQTGESGSLRRALEDIRQLEQHKHHMFMSKARTSEGVQQVLVRHGNLFFKLSFPQIVFFTIRHCNPRRSLELHSNMFLSTLARRFAFLFVLTS